MERSSQEQPEAGSTLLESVFAEKDLGIQVDHEPEMCHCCNKGE